MNFSTPKLRVSVLEAINQNKNLFKYGTSFSRPELFKLIRDFYPYPDKITPRSIMQYNMNMVATQRLFNQYLRKYGLYMKTRDYYEEFYIVTREQAQNKVARFVTDANEKLKASQELDFGLTTYNGSLPSTVQ